MNGPSRVLLEVLPIALSIALLSGCASGGDPPAKTAHAPPAAEPAELEAGIYEVQSGAAVEPEALFERLARAQVVIVGESHDAPVDHAVQAEIYEALLAHHDAPVALGMEMFQRPFQGPLDAFVAGEMDEEQMLIHTEWAHRWGFEPALYRPLWELAIRTKSPIVALNVRQELTKRVAAVGIDGLSPAERADLPTLDLDDDAYRAWMAGIFEEHDMEMSPERFDCFFQAQVLWDEAMAESAADFLAANPQVAAMVVVAGRGHVEGGRGIPPRLRRRMSEPHTVVTVVPVGIDAGPLERLQAEEIADYVWVTAP